MVRLAAVALASDSASRNDSVPRLSRPVRHLPPDAAGRAAGLLGHVAVAGNWSFALACILPAMAWLSNRVPDGRLRPGRQSRRRRAGNASDPRRSNFCFPAPGRKRWERANCFVAVALDPSRDGHDRLGNRRTADARGRAARLSRSCRRRERRTAIRPAAQPPRRRCWSGCRPTGAAGCCIFRCAIIMSRSTPTGDRTLC